MLKHNHVVSQVLLIEKCGSAIGPLEVVRNWCSRRILLETGCPQGCCLWKCKVIVSLMKVEFGGATGGQNALERAATGIDAKGDSKDIERLMVLEMAPGT